MSLHRRGAVSLAASLLTGGCLSVVSGSCDSGVNVELHQFDPFAELGGRVVRRQRRIAAEAIEGDDPRVTVYRAAPFTEPTLVPHDGAVYRVGQSTVDSVDVPAFAFSVDWHLEQKTAAGTEGVRFEALPENDRRAFLIVAPPPDGHPPEGFEVNEFPAPYPDDGDDSVLVGGTSWVEWEGKTVRVEVADERTGTVQRITYDIAAERVAADEAAFRSHLAEEYLVDLSDAPEPQLEVLREARGDVYGACEPRSDTPAALRERLAEEPTLPEPYPDDWYVAFDGERSRLSLTEWDT